MAARHRKLGSVVENYRERRKTANSIQLWYMSLVASPFWLLEREVLFLPDHRPKLAH
jgi:hypothetical protein